MPTSNYNPSAYQEAGNNNWYLKQVNEDGTDLISPDVFGRMQIKITSTFNDTTPSHDVIGDDKEPFTSIADPRAIGFEFEVGQDDVATQDLLQSAKGKYWSVVNMVGVSSYNNTSSVNEMKIEWFPVAKLDPTYTRTTPDGRKPRFTFKPQKNRGATAQVLTNAGAITGALTTADVDSNLNSAAWDALDFSVAVGEYMDVKSCIMAS